MTGFYDIRDPKTILKFSDSGNFSCFFLCEKGGARILLNNHIYNLKESTISIIPPFSSMRFIEKSDNLEGWIMKMDMEDIADAMLQIPYDKKLEIRRDSCRCITNAQQERIMNLKKVIEDRVASMGEEGYFMVGNIIRSLKKAFCYEVTQACASGAEHREKQKDRNDEVFNIFLSSLSLKFATERSVAYYAELQDLSPAYFSAIIKAVSGKPAKFWIENQIFTSAVNYLRNPNFSIGEIAGILNFPDQSSFGKFFKKISGLSPFDYRKNYL